MSAPASAPVTVAEEARQPGRFWGLRVSELVAIAFLAYIAVASLFFPIGLRERLAVTALNALIVLTFLLLARQGPRPRLVAFAVVRDWLPCALIPIAYREAMLFFRPDGSHRLDLIFGRWDTWLLTQPAVEWPLRAGFPVVQSFLELSYLLTYPLIPAGFLVVWILCRQRVLTTDGAAVWSQQVDRYWTPVLLAVLTSYVIYPLFPLTPPRALFHEVSLAELHLPLRRLNEWVLRWNGDQASLFPSGHVAAVVATALAVCATLPRWGVVFLVAALSITVATVVGRYHYGADAVAGVLLAVAALAVSKRIAAGRARKG